MTKSNEKISPLQYQKGIGPIKAKALLSNGIASIEDMLKYFPRAYVDRSPVTTLQSISIRLMNKLSFDELTSINSINIKNEVTIIARIYDIKEVSFSKFKKLLILKIVDDTRVNANILFWNRIEYFKKRFKIDDNLIISGKPELDKYNTIIFNHPGIEIIEPDDEILLNNSIILPIYSISEKMSKSLITQKSLRDLIANLIENELKNLTETLPEYILKENNLPDIYTAIQDIHFPKNINDSNIAKNRFKYEEIFYFEIFLAGKQTKFKNQETAPKFNSKSKLARKLYDSLNYELTNDQKKAIREIAADLESGSPMNRLLQGDVGSGKTIVSVFAMLIAIESGFQTAIVAPTELLAEQHFHTITNLLKGFDLKITQLVGGQKARLRREVFEEIKTGLANVIIGTHALFEDTVEYNNLGLIIIDEQHRFGVSQRASIKKLGKISLKDENHTPHTLVMSATPIPRTLSMTIYGDLDVSIIKEKPKNRIPVKTSIIFESEIQKSYDFIRGEISKGNQAFIVYPLVEDSEKLDYKSAVTHYEKLKNEIFPDLKVGLLHGQMFWYEKEETMQAFKNKEYDILVATTVIEVGIDIPSATIMMIENADRFGLSQLHQLRGRVGRNDKQCYCLLIAKDKYRYELIKQGVDQEKQKAVIIRLKAMCDYSDGFDISEIDLKLRGPGDILGTRQAGMPNFKFIDLISDGDIISKARKDAFNIVQADPKLSDSKNIIIKNNYIKLFKNENYYGIA